MPFSLQEDTATLGSDRSACKDLKRQYGTDGSSWAVFVFAKQNAVNPLLNSRLYRLLIYSDDLSYFIVMMLPLTRFFSLI
jgi:hypothetical protein